MIQSQAVLTVNTIAKKLSASNVLAFLHKVVVIDTWNLSVVYRFSAMLENKVGVIDTGNSSVVYRDTTISMLRSIVIDTGNSSVVYRFQNKVAISFKIWYKKYMILFCRIS